ncbi:hypothetical protein [Streptomyces sp. NPDC047315]|uniref:hypothetical protein n=1 Tax=Streptomyces sp. NPDC047315 TaxID=3155142 RepID=UPI0033C089DB
MPKRPPTTGIKTADEIITLADGYNMTVTVDSKTTDTTIAHVVRIEIPVPVPYIGTALGVALAADTLTLLWTKPLKKGARFRLEDATLRSLGNSRKVRTFTQITSAVHVLGRSAVEHARAAAPHPDEVIDALHAHYVNGRKVHSVPADRVRKVVSICRFAGRLVHQDDEGTVHTSISRFVPLTPRQHIEEQQHVRTVNGGTPELVDSRAARAEINHAMMDGKRDVREMSESDSTARIVYRDQRGTVDLRPVHKGDTLPAHEQRPTVQELTGPIDSGLLAYYAETVAAVDDGTAIPVRADMVRPGMVVIAAVRLEDRTVSTVKAFNGSVPWVRVTWTTRTHADSVMGDSRVFEPGCHLMVTVDSLRELYGAAVARPATAEGTDADTTPEAERYAPGDRVIVRGVYYRHETREHRTLPEYAGTVVNWASPHYNVRSLVADEHGHGVRPCRVHELRPATAEDIARLVPTADELRARRSAEGFAAKWWAEQRTEEPTDDALRAVFAQCVKPPRPERYPAIRVAIAAMKPPAAAAPLFAALAAYETVTEAFWTEAPRELHTLAMHLETLPLAAPVGLHPELRAARDAAEDAWESLRTAATNLSRTHAREKVRAALVRARAAVLAVEPRAERMRGTYMPATAEEIRAAARAFLATMGTPDERAAIDTGTPCILVRSHPTLDGEQVVAAVTAAIETPTGHIPAHPPVTLCFPYLDDRLSLADNARKALHHLFDVDVPIEYRGWCED